MKNFKVTLSALVFALAIFSGTVKASGPRIANYPNSSCSKGICANVAKSGTSAQINVGYSQNRLNGQVTMNVLLNGKEIGSATATFDRGGMSFHLPISTLDEGSLEIYFVNDRGQYDSDFGRNFQFEL
jgi:hypothetical protein